MDGTGGGRGAAATAAGLLCGSCGTELPPDSRFCNKCGAPVRPAATSAEYKQVTVLFADVVHSMDLAAAVGAERLREIMAELVDRAAVVVQHFDGTVGGFTGDGVMAVFGARVALEDHAIRACLAALGVQDEAKRLAVDIDDRDGVDLQLRVGLNSSQVIAGEMGSGPFGYTTIGEQVGMAQRMESVAPPGGVMLSASTAGLVDDAATLGESELVQIKGADGPVPARRLLGMQEQHGLSGVQSRTSSVGGGRCPPLRPCWTVQSRATALWSVCWVRPASVRAVSCAKLRRWLGPRFCESHTSQVPFHAVSGLLRAATGVDRLGPQAARDRVRDWVPDADGDGPSSHRVPAPSSPMTARATEHS